MEIIDIFPYFKVKIQFIDKTMAIILWNLMTKHQSVNLSEVVQNILCGSLRQERENNEQLPTVWSLYTYSEIMTAPLKQYGP